MNSKKLASLYGDAHNMMRNIDGLQPQESFDELLKFLFFKESTEGVTPPELALESTVDPLGRFTAPVAAITKQMRKEFKSFVKSAPPAIRQVWPNGTFRLSDDCLSGVANLFAAVRLTNLGLDVRSAAIREFMPPEIRKGLGIYLTPDEVVRATVEIVAPIPADKVLDPACGSGTFLLEVARLWESRTESRKQIWGVDKNPRMLILADLNLGHLPWLNFDGKLLDSLFDIGKESTSDWFNSFDCIFTNPPFGVYVDAGSQDGHRLKTCIDNNGKAYSRQQSEIVFIEQCFRLLKPGGRLAIVLPKSVVTNHGDRVSDARSYFGSQGYVEGIMTLPPETFYATGTQANTVVLFARKYLTSIEATETTKIWLAEITNCGYDSTGRARAGSQLKNIVNDVRALTESSIANEDCRWLGDETKSQSFSRLPALLASEGEVEVDGVPLRDLAVLITTGRTPTRSSYTDTGLFLVKVGNLSGKGIDWAARDRNFLPVTEREKRKKAGLLLQVGDIVLTSSAHSPVYIAKKVDIISEIPEWVGSEASLVGEVMLLRPDPQKIDPFVLLGFLRNPDVMRQIQRMVRGQTAHLHPKDLGELKVPHRLLTSNKQASQLSAMLQEEARLSRLSNVLAWKLDKQLSEMDIS